MATSSGSRGGKGLTQGETADRRPWFGLCAELPRQSDWRLCAELPAGPHRLLADVRPKGGARCVSSARRDLYGWRGAILVPTATLEAKVQYAHALAHAPQWNAPSHRLLIIAGFFAGLGRCQSARPQSLVISLRRPSPTQNEAILRVRNITSLQDKP